jgi:hypothetical protein
MDKAEAEAATELGCEDCGMGCAIGRTVERELLVEMDRLSVRQECRQTVGSGGRRGALRDQRKSQSSKCCVKR